MRTTLRKSPANIGSIRQETARPVTVSPRVVICCASRMIDQVSKVASSPAIAIVGAGAALANPGAFIPLALKTISETNPGAAQYFVEWVFFALVSLLPLGVALLLLVFTPDRAERILGAARIWIERNARTVAGVLVIALAAALLRNGISGLVS